MYRITLRAIRPGSETVIVANIATAKKCVAVNVAKYQHPGTTVVRAERFRVKPLVRRAS